MKVNIERAIKSITETIDYYQPLYESIVNAYQADASNIKIKFLTKDDYVIGYSVEDDGEGFTNKNIDSYLELWSDYNIKKGALGSGRILCLKVFDNIIINSQTKDTKTDLGQKVKINFNRHFKFNTIEEIAPIKSSSNKSFTITEFKNINEDYLALYEKEKESFNLDKIQENIFIRLLPMFIKFNNEKKDFSIMIDTTRWLDKNNLEKQFQEHKFEKDSFTITKDLAIYNKGDEDLKDEQNFNFTLLYRIKEDKNENIEQFYGASDRFIHNFTKGVRLDSLPKGQGGIFCLTSPYLDKRVKDSRNKFNIHETNPSKESPVVFTEIKDELKKLLNKILLNKFPETKKEFSDRKKLAVEKFPHLSRYIKKIDSLTMSESDMLAQAEKEFISETKKVRKEVENFTKKVKSGKNFNEKAYKEITQHFTQVGREQLADYIGYRQTIINMLMEIYIETAEEKSRFDEKDIHNLFMPQYTKSATSFHYANNVWIFDDKFMSYNYSASEPIVAQIVSDVTGKPKEEILEHQRNKKLDLIMLYSNPDSEWKDVLLVEFKRLNCSIDDKEKAINQLNRYPKYIIDNIENVRSVHAYTIIDIDLEFIESLKEIHGFTENAFGDKDQQVSAYYKYNPNVKAHINVVSFSQVLEDANKRNKVFLDILIQNFKA